MNIGRKTRILDIKSVWKKENDFSDWLTTDDGIALLADELGIEVENLQREVRGVDYPCDIVGNILGDEHHKIVIENQYGKTDHDHLGKLLTYAAVQKAMTGIWISETISDDHRQVIDWLNENTPDHINLYLVGLKLYNVAEHSVVAQLDVVCRPNNEVKVIATPGSPAERERRQWRIHMWGKIGDAIRATKPPFRLQKPSGSHWSSIAIGRSNFVVSMLLNTRRESIGIDLTISVDWKSEAFEALLEQKDEIEKVLGPLEWLPLEDKNSSRIVMSQNIDPKNPANEQAVLAWFAENLQKFYDVFKDRVARLEAQ